MTDGLITFLIPSHRPALLREALASIEAQHGDPARIHVLVTHARGIWPQKLNEIAALVRTPYLALLCDDDRLAPGYVDEVLARFTARDTPDIVSTDAQEFGDRTGYAAMRAWSSREDFACSPPIWISSAMTTALWRSLGGFDPDQIFQDWDFWYRAFCAGATRAHLPRALFHYRVHAEMGTLHINDAHARHLIYAKHPELRDCAATLAGVTP